MAIRRFLAGMATVVMMIGAVTVYRMLTHVSVSRMVVPVERNLNPGSGITNVFIADPSVSCCGLLPRLANAEHHTLRSSLVTTGSFTTTLVTVSPDGRIFGGSYPSISRDGRYIMFFIGPTNIPPSLSGNSFAIYDRESRELSSVPLGKIGAAVLSANGRYVAFLQGNNPNDPTGLNNIIHVFVYDRETGITSLASVADDGTEGNDDSGAVLSVVNTRIAISADGRYVAFTSDASNLVANDTNNHPDVFVRDRETGQTQRVSVSSKGEQGVRASFSPSMSADGRYIAFDGAFNFVDGSLPCPCPTLFVHDRETKQTSPVSVTSDGQGVNNARWPSISADGRYVAFVSFAPHVVSAEPVDYLRKGQVYVHDRETGETTLVSRAPNGTPGEAYSGTPSISAHGRYVVFQSNARNLISSESNEDLPVDLTYVHDRETGQTRIASIASDGTPGGFSDPPPAISWDGRVIAFASSAGNLIPGPSPIFGPYVFLHEPGYEADTEEECVLPDTASDPTGDADGDGLLNQWEACGYNKDGAGAIDLALHEMGADPTRKDIFVEIDYMETITHSHRPITGTVEDVIAVFATKGISLHVLVDEALPEIEPIGFYTGTVQVTPAGTFNDLKLGNPVNPCGTTVRDGHFGTVADRSSDNCQSIIAARRDVFRYAIFGHNHAHWLGSSGVAELPGNDLMVTLGGLSSFSSVGGRRAAEAATFMHEFGHTLNLKHGGGNHVNCKPNYLSVMNYTLQFTQYDPVRPLDYSGMLLRPLNEMGGLNESTGIGGPAGRHVIFGMNGVITKTLADGPVNWNGSGSSNDENVTADINFIARINGCPGDGYTSLEGYDDWRNLTLNFRMSVDFADGAGRVTAYPEERTFDDILKEAEAFDFDEDGYSNAVDTCVTLPNPDQTDTDGDGWGDVCDNCPTVPNSDENGINADSVGAACKDQGGNNRLYLPIITASHP